jgi:hypothetical protein
MDHAVDFFEERIFPILSNSFECIANLKVDMPKSCLLTTEVDDLQAMPKTLIRKPERGSNAFIGSDIHIIFNHENGIREDVGKLTTEVIFSHANGQNMVIMTVNSIFNKNFQSMDALVSGFDGILKEYVNNFRMKNDTSYSVYFELCNKFFPAKLAIKLGFLPGWLNHAMASGKSFNHLKSHSLFLIDKFLAIDDCNSISIDSLVSNYGKIEKQDICPGIVPQNWQDGAVSMVFYYPIWNRNVDSENMYRMKGDFWNKNAPDYTKNLLENFSQKYIDRLLTEDDVLKVLSQR